MSNGLKMKSIVVTYPYFQSLPKEIKKMLVTLRELVFCGNEEGSEGKQSG